MDKEKPKLRRTQIYLMEMQHDWYINQSRKLGISISELIRRALDEYRERREGGK